MDFSSKPWWRTDSYDREAELGRLDQEEYWGPNGAALVPLWDNGTTWQGWGRDTFMDQYNKNAFSATRVLFGYNKKRWNFAFVMRSARLVCIDIDGKNGGFDHASELGFLPPTAAETSKSGNGYHLFYLVDDEWDDKEGFARFKDHIGIVTGVDIRGTGCVYHYPSQRWNNRMPVMIPIALRDRLLQKVMRQQQQAAVISKTLELEPEEVAIMHDELITELAKPIPAGKRNNTLFAIGSKLKAAQVDDWQDKVRNRADEVGLDEDEVDKLVNNIERYGE